MNKNCGIYKITSPTGRVYIGQSKNLKRRYSEYENLSSKIKSQGKLYNSLVKYGWENHQFDIIEYCSEEKLDCSERFWQDEFDVLNRGLNCILQECGEQKYVVSQSTKNLLSSKRKGKLNSFYGKTHTDSTKEKLRLQRIGGTQTKESNIKRSESLKNREFSEAHRKKLSESGIGRVVSQSTRDKISKKAIGRKRSPETSAKQAMSIKGVMAKGNHPQAKLVLCNQTGIFYDCIEDASEAINIKSGTLRAMLSGRNSNRTCFILV